MAGYTRQDIVNNIADGNIINASDFDNEYDAIEAAFSAVSGHTHDGTAAEGAPITKVGPNQDVVVSASAVLPKTDNTLDLGSSSFEFKDLYIDGTANIDSLVADTADINAGTIDGVVIGGASAGAGTFTTVGATTGNITTVNATTVDTTNIEVTSLKAKDGTAAGSIANSTGVVTLNSSILTTTDINGGTIDGVTIGGASAGAGTFTSLNASGNVSFDGGSFVFNEAGADRDARFEGDGDPNLLFLDASSDRIGIGTNNPQYKVDIAANANGVRGSRIRNNDSGSSASSVLQIGNDTNGAAAALILHSSTNTTALGGANALSLINGLAAPLVFATTNIERVRITPDSYLRMASGTGGIQFNGDTSASNALDDYEEGTWTPVLSDASTGGNVAPSGTFSGSYTKVGRIVTVTVLATNFDTTGMTAGNDLFIQGLPFTARSVTNVQLFTGACVVGFATVLNNPVLSVPDNTSHMRIAESVINIDIDFMVVSEFSSGNADIYGTITYETA